MATLRNKRKLAAVSRETLESTRSGRTQNILDPELTQDYISQVSEEIEGELLKNSRRSLAEQSQGSWEPCQSLTSSSWTHKFGIVP